MKLRALGWAAVSTVPQASKEKESLPVQEREIRALCEREGWQLVEMLRVPGHSRSYLDFHQMASDAANVGITAFLDLERHWDNSDFDVLITRDGNRFAREQPPHAYMVLRTIRSGAFIQLVSGGRVDEDNANMFVAMDGYRAAQDVSELRRKFQFGMTGRAKRGLLMGSHQPLSHRVVRDSSGKAIGTEVNPVNAPMFELAARLLIDGVTWEGIGLELKRLGFRNPKGNPFPRQSIYRNFMNPVFYGHIARGHYGKTFGPWIFGPDELPPDGVEIYYDRIEPAIPEALIEPVQNELRQRMTRWGRGNWTENRYRFSGLGICAECGTNLSVRSSYNRQHTELVRNGLGCYIALPSQNRAQVKTCSQTKYISHKDLQDFFEHLLEEILAGDDFLADVDMFPETDTTAALEAQLASVTRQIDTLITEQSLAPESVQPRYRQRIEDLARQHDTLQAQLQTKEYTRRDVERQYRRQLRAVEELREMTLEAFWELPDPAINRLLRQLLGDLRIFVRKRKIVDFRSV